MRPSYRVVHIANRYIDWVKLGVASRDRNDCLVCAKDNWNEHRTMRFWIRCDDVLYDGKILISAQLAT